MTDVDPKLDFLAGFGCKLASGLLDAALNDLPKVHDAMKATKGKGGELRARFLRRLACEDDRVAAAVALAAENPAAKRLLESLGFLPKDATPEPEPPKEP